MTTQQIRVEAALKHLVQRCTLSIQAKTQYPYLPDLVIDIQHRDLMHINTTLLDILNYINEESEVEQRQDSQLKVSRVFAVSS